MKLRIEAVGWQQGRALLSEIRTQVFVEEQGVAIAEEWDHWDESSQHWLIYSDSGEAIGTARLTSQGQIGRMAVLKSKRNQGVGFELLKAVIEDASPRFDNLYLHAQIHATGFYQRAGFVAIGPIFEEAGIVHQKMILDSRFLS